jgi:Tfp pilus assembly protein PilV
MRSTRGAARIGISVHGSRQGTIVSRLRWWHLAADDEEGLGLVEVLVAVFILSVALMALASVGTSSLISLRMTRDREQATNAASTALEEARALSFDALALPAGANPTTLPADVRAALNVTSATCVGGEALVTDAASPQPVPLTRTSGTNGAHRVHTVVTWANQNCTATNSGLKRVVSIVTWPDGPRFNFVRNETLVAPAGRGLPNPNFDVKPSRGAVMLTAAQVANGSTRCVEHQLRNLGAGDSYSYEVGAAKVAGSATAFSPAGVGGYSIPTAGWQLQAHLEPGSTASRAGLPPATATNAFAPAAGSPRPVAPLRVEAAEQALLTLCWTPSTDARTDVEVTINVHSRFDDRRIETVTHTLTIGDPVRRLYLQDWNDQVAHPRGEPGNNDNQLRYRAQVMNPRSSGASADRAQLPADTLLDWSTEFAPQRDGIRVPRASNNNPRLDQIEYRYQLAAPVQMLPGATLHLWHAPTGALPATTPATPLRVELQVELDVLTANDKTNDRVWPTTGPFTHTYMYSHAEPGFRRHSIPLAFAQTVPIAANQRIRVRVTCLPASVQDCNLALDTVQHDSHLEVRLQ